MDLRNNRMQWNSSTQNSQPATGKTMDLRNRMLRNSSTHNSNITVPSEASMMRHRTRVFIECIKMHTTQMLSYRQYTTASACSSTTTSFQKVANLPRSEGLYIHKQGRIDMSHQIRAAKAGISYRASESLVLTVIVLLICIPNSNHHVPRPGKQQFHQQTCQVRSN